MNVVYSRSGVTEEVLELTEVVGPAAEDGYVPTDVTEYVDELTVLVGLTELPMAENGCVQMPSSVHVTEQIN